jgi:hypothetical protein
MRPFSEDKANGGKVPVPAVHPYGEPNARSIDRSHGYNVGRFSLFDPAKALSLGNGRSPMLCDFGNSVVQRQSPGRTQAYGVENQQNCPDASEAFVMRGSQVRIL